MCPATWPLKYPRDPSAKIAGALLHHAHDIPLEVSICDAMPLSRAEAEWHRHSATNNLDEAISSRLASTRRFSEKRFRLKRLDQTNTGELSRKLT